MIGTQGVHKQDQEVVTAGGWQPGSLLGAEQRCSAPEAHPGTSRRDLERDLGLQASAVAQRNVDAEEFIAVPTHDRQPRGTGRLEGSIEDVLTGDARCEGDGT